MRRHTTFCKRISMVLGVHPDRVDTFYECRNLDEAIRSLGLNWREIGSEVLIGIVEAPGYPDGKSVEVYQRLLRERVDQLL